MEPWLRSLPPNRKKAYQTVLNRFCDFCKITPMDLLVETRDALFRFDTPPSREKLNKWKEELIASKLRPGTVQQYRNRVLSFLSYHIDRLGKEYGNRSYRRSSILFDPLKQGEVKLMVEKAKHRHHKAVIGFLAQTGQRVAVLGGITWGMIDWTGWKPYGIASVLEKSYRFVIGKDTMSLLDQWPETEKRKADGGFVFGLSERQIHRIVAEAADDANVQKDSRESMPDKTILYRVHPDAFPTYWNGRVRDGGMVELQRKHMMGRDVSYDPRERDLFSVDRLVAAYSKAEPKLSLFELVE